jgi:hypothetical protein
MTRLFPIATAALLSLAACGGSTTGTPDMPPTPNTDGGTADLSTSADMTFVPPTLDVSACAAGTSTLGTNVYPIIMATCATASCHSPGVTSPNMAGGKSTFFTNVVGVASATSRPSLPNLKFVVANDVNNSFLLYKILGQQSKIPSGGGSMPLGGSLTAAQQCLIINWVRGGALNN